MKETLRILSAIIMLLIAAAAPAQESSQPINGTIAIAIVDNGDTVLFSRLPTLYVYPELKFKNEKQEKFYWKTVRDVKRTLPYAKMIAKMLDEYHHDMEGMTEKEKKAYMESRESELYDTYAPVAKKMTVRQGKMLIRLVDRYCNRTGYEIVKELRGGFRAFFWQGIAKICGTDLKEGFDETKEENQIILRVINLVESGQLP